MAIRKLIAATSVGLAFMTLAGAAVAQSGRIEAVTPYRALPDTKWLKAEAIGDNPLEQALRAATDQLLAEKGYTIHHTSTYAVRVEVWRGSQAPLPPPANIPGYQNAPKRLSIVSNRGNDATGLYLSLTMYHQASGQVFWQAEVMCPAVAADAASITANIIKPLLAVYWGKAAKPGSFACAPLKA